LPARPSLLPLYFSWLGTLTAALVLMLGEILPLRLTFVTPGTLFTCLLEVQVFYMVLVWPFFVMGRRATDRPARSLYRDLGVLLAMGLPLGLMAADVSSVRPGHFLRAWALIGALGAFGVSIFRFATRASAGPWYFLGAFIVSAALPFASFLASEFIGHDWGVLAAASPFWGAARLEEGADLFQTPFYALLAAALSGGAALFRRVDASPGPK
jgi:hypothetical protein